MIVLVNMPGAEVTRPSLALGILARLLRDADHTVRVVDANLLWLDRVGPEPYLATLETSPADMVLEFVFAAAAFPERTPDVDAFVALACTRDAALALRGPEWLRALLVPLIADAPRFVDALAEELCGLDPRAVGCSSMFQQHAASLALLRALRRRRPGVATVLGGANCEGPMGRAAHAAFPWVDYVVSGEAEHIAVPLFDALVRDETVAPGDAPPGLFVPGHRGGAYPVDPGTGRTPRASVTDMRDVPVPDYDDYFGALRAVPSGRLVVPGLPFETSRGCWWGAKQHCTFCGLNGSTMAFRARDAAAAAAQIRAMQARYDTPRLEAVDNILSMGFFESLLPDLAADRGDRTLFFETKANLRTAHVRALSAAGVLWIQPGIESLDSRVLALMRKGTTAAQNIQLLRDCAQHGVFVAWSMILGFPGEDDAWHAETASLVPALFHLGAGGVAALRFDRFSPYAERPEAWGLSLVPAAPYAHVYPVDDATLGDLAYYFDAVPASDRVGDLFHRPLAEPGAEQLRRAVVAWRGASARGARLELHRRGDDVEIVDTRAAEDAVPVPVGAAVVAVLDACREARGRASVEQALLAGGVDGAVAALDEAIARRWVLEVDGRLLCVVLDAPVAALAPEIQFPGGTLLRPELFD